MSNILPSDPSPALRMTEAAFCRWLGQALPGETFEYHRGRLALDTDKHASGLPDRDRAELARVARRARWAAECGLVHLLQRRIAPDDYRYLAAARRKPKTALISLVSSGAKEAV